MSRLDAIVVGAGVSGLTTAHELLAAGLRVELWAKDRPPHTTADVAAAFWYPFLVNPSARVDAWATTAYARFRKLAHMPGNGVVMREVFELRPDHDDHGAATPAWVAQLDGLRPMTASELGDSHRRGRRFFAPVIETPRYMPWLVERIERCGAKIVSRSIDSFEPAFERAPIVVNATGLGARQLTGDLALISLEGVLVKIEPPPGWPDDAPVVVDERRASTVAYVVPRSGDVVLGGTARPVPPPPTTRPSDPSRASADDVEAIVSRCTGLVPDIGRATRREVCVGYRPYRAEIRLELERHDKGWLVHNYGHGGAGVTLSWGCAAQAVHELAQTGYPGLDAVPRTAS